MDPLEEPEVLLFKGKEKDEGNSKQYRQNLPETKRKSQSKKLSERDVKEEPVDMDSKSYNEGTTTTTTEIEVIVNDLYVKGFHKDIIEGRNGYEHFK